MADSPDHSRWRRFTREDLPDDGPRGPYTKEMYDRAMARIAARRAWEDEDLLRDEYMRAMFRAFMRRLRRMSTDPGIRAIAEDAASVDESPKSKPQRPPRKKSRRRAEPSTSERP